MNKKLTLILTLIIFSTLIVGCSKEEKTIQNKLLKEENIDSFNGNQIVLENGKKINFQTDVSNGFPETDKIRNKTKSESEDVVKEYYDRVIIERTTTVEIEDSEEYEEVFGEDPEPEYDITENKTPEDLIDNFKDNCRNDRTLPFCEKSKEEIEKILENKTGTYEIVERINIKKIPVLDFVLDGSKFPEFLKDPEDIRVSKDYIDGSLVLEGNSEFSLMPLRGMQYGGPSYQEQIFIDGFTYGFEFSYDMTKRWTSFGQEVAKASVYSYLGAGLGLRIPFKTDVKIANSLLSTYHNNYTATIDVEPIDLDEQRYYEAGISQQQLFSGKELVIKFGALAGGKLKLFGSTVFESEFGNLIDESQDFVPPLNNEMVNLGRLEFKGKDTGLRYGTDNYYIAGDIGVTFNLKGEYIKFDCTGLNSNCPSEIEISDKEILELEAQTESYSQEDEFGKYENFGITLENPKYKSSANFGTEFSLETGLNTGSVFGWVRVNSPWIEIYNFDISMPYLTRHSNTENQLKANKNKIYKEMPTAELEVLGPLAFNLTDRCSALHDAIDEGSEVEGVDDERVNIYTEFGDEIGSFRVIEGIMTNVDCYNMFENPTYEVEFDDYYVIEELGEGPLYSQATDLMGQDRLEINGIGAVNQFQSTLANLGLQVMNLFN